MVNGSKLLRVPRSRASIRPPARTWDPWPTPGLPTPAGPSPRPDQAFGEWSGLTAYQRSAHLYDAWRIMTERREELARLMT